MTYTGKIFNIFLQNIANKMCINMSYVIAKYMRKQVSKLLAYRLLLSPALGAVCGGRGFCAPLREVVPTKTVMLLLRYYFKEPLILLEDLYVS